MSKGMALVELRFEKKGLQRREAGNLTINYLLSTCHIIGSKYFAFIPDNSRLR